MNEADLVKIRTALEQDTLTKACDKMQAVLADLGYTKQDETSRTKW